MRVYSGDANTYSSVACYVRPSVHHHCHYHHVFALRRWWQNCTGTRFHSAVGQASEVLHLPPSPYVRSPSEVLPLSAPIPVVCSTHLDGRNGGQRHVHAVDPNHRPLDPAEPRTRPVRAAPVFSLP